MTRPLEWQDEYTVGVKELDGQHQALLNIINTLLMEERDENDADTLFGATSSLIHYAYIHFATEERYLAEAHFPHLEQHILMHVDFIMKTLELSLKVKEGTRDSRLELLHYLKGWYSSHVLGIDRLYIPFLQANRFT